MRAVVLRPLPALEWVTRLGELVAALLRRFGFASSWAGVELQAINGQSNPSWTFECYSQGILQVLINLHDSSLVTTSVAVIGSYKD